MNMRLINTYMITVVATVFVVGFGGSIVVYRLSGGEEWTALAAGLAIVWLITAICVLSVHHYLVVMPMRRIVGRVRKYSDDGAELDWDIQTCDHVGDCISMVGDLLLRLQDAEDQCERMTAELREQSRLVCLGELAAGVAHELNNPLGGIIVYAHLLKEDTTPDDPRYANIEKVIRESDRCRRIVRGLLDYARREEPRLEMISPGTVIDDAVRNLTDSNTLNGVTVTRRRGNNIPLVSIDPSLMQEVFENIIRNAVDIMDGEGEITITDSLECDGNGRENVRIDIADTGPGIPEQYLGKIFDPFFTTKRKTHGTGLGLAVCRNIVRKHNGTLTARNGDECGAVFSVCLPCGGDRS